MFVARLRLASLWLSQVSRIAADNALRVFIALRVAERGQSEREYAWHLLSALLMLPAVVLAPFNGALGNSLPKRWVLTGSAAYCLLIVAACGWLGGPWVAGWALLAVGAAVYSPTRYALLPAAAVDTAMPLTRVNGWIEMGAVSAIVAGMALGVHLERETATWLGLPPTVAAAIALGVVAVASAWPVWFRADVRRPENANQAISGFFSDGGRIWADRDARAALLALAVLRALVTGATGALFAVVLSAESVPLLERIESVFALSIWLLIGAAAGSLLAGVQRHPRRALGLVPLAATGFCAGLAFAAADALGPIAGFCLGVMGGLINVPLAAAYQQFLPADARGNGMAIRNLTDYLLMTAMALLLFGLASAGVLDPSGQLGLVAALAGIAAFMAWKMLYREALEQLLEWLLWPLYRIRGHGSVDKIDPRGPLVVVANHAAWLDPMFLGKVLPREIRPMMTSVFYDMPVVRWLMVHVIRAIRVPAATFRREAPELQEAVRALDAGECVVIFPEGSLRKTEEKPLRHFGQGVYHILSQRPNTPVVVCWIEGGWRSFTSYFNGPPTKNKRLDFWRRVDVAVSEPQVLDAATLENHRATRAFLEERVRAMRGELGLDIPNSDEASQEEK